MVNPKQLTLQNQFKLHETKFSNSSNYLASQLDVESPPNQLGEILAALKAVASKLENLAEQLSAHMTPDDLEPYIQKSADASILVLHYADKISSRQLHRDSNSRRSHLSDLVPASRQLFNEQTTPRLPDDTDNRPHVSSSTSYANPNANLLDMTGEQLSRHLAQSTDRRNFCADEPAPFVLNNAVNNSAEIRHSQPEQPNLVGHPGATTLPQTLEVVSANPTQQPQPSALHHPYYNRDHITKVNKYHQQHIQNHHL